MLFRSTVFTIVSCLSPVADAAAAARLREPGSPENSFDSWKSNASPVQKINNNKSFIIDRKSVV